MSNPTQGGSYIRRKDGTLERVAFTEPLSPLAPPEAPPTPGPPPTDPGTKPKLKD